MAILIKEIKKFGETQFLDVIDLKKNIKNETLNTNLVHNLDIAH